MATFVSGSEGIEEQPQVNTQSQSSLDDFMTKEEEKYPRMTKEYLRKHCRDLKLYVTPYLNDVLYLHFKGFSKIENLEEYTGLKCLWLESNGIGKIDNLNNPELRCLFLQQNLIKKIENLSHLQNLSQLNLSHNMIQKIEGLDALPRLETLQISHNKLEDRDSLLGLVGCDHISCLDLSHNYIDGEIVDILSEIKSLRVLYLMGNPITRSLRHYRRKLIFYITELTYLDDRPVFPRERACTEAWFSGGVEAENQERQLWISRENKKIRDSVDVLSNLRKKSTALKIEKELREDHDRQCKTGPYPVVDVDSVCWLSGEYKLVEEIEQTSQQESPQPTNTEDETLVDTNEQCKDVEDIIQPKFERCEGIFGGDVLRQPKLTNMRLVLDACKNNEDNISVLGDDHTTS